MTKVPGLMVRICLIFWSLLLVTGAKAKDLNGVSDPQRAEYNWVMHCRGCHGVNAKGSKGGAPNMVGEVGQFLHSPEGRAFLGRVPGVAFVELPDNEVAELLNWLIQKYDTEGMPNWFKPYGAEEVKQLRQRPLISQAFKKRQDILKNMRELKY